MARRNVCEGVFAINKPYNISSAQVIRDCQEYFNPSKFFQPLIEEETTKMLQGSNPKWRKRKMKRATQVKMGHGGTLDPLATGVLILGVGKGTKSLNKFLGCTKSYETIVVFGAATDTYDRAGRVLKKRQYDHITQKMVEDALDDFRGKYQQMPPLYSALKMEGKPLYEYAREGKPLPREIATREVEVTNLELVEWYEPGTHDHRWPLAEATQAEMTYAEQLWRAEKQQATGKKLSPEEEEAESQALAAHETFKRKADERQDELVIESDRQSKRRKIVQEPPMMSGALGDLPKVAGKGTNLIPALAPGTPPPWEGKGPPAAKIRMTVTSGFYVRSFCHDLGEKLGSAALMAELVRDRQGGFALSGPDCLEYKDLEKGEAVWAPKVESMLRRWAEKTAGGRDGVEDDLPVKKTRPALGSALTNGSIRKTTEARDEPASSAATSPGTTNKTQDQPSKKTLVAETSELKESIEQNDSLPALKAIDSKAAASADNDDEWNGFTDPVQGDNSKQKPPAIAT